MTLAFNTELRFGSRSSVHISAEEASRAERLFRVANTLDQNDAIPRGMYRLYEHAGNLEVYYSTRPTDARVFRVIHEVWASECECVVRHFISDGQSAELFLEDYGPPTLKPQVRAVDFRQPDRA